jgi:two-component system, LytTR family, response regulator
MSPLEIADGSTLDSETSARGTRLRVLIADDESLSRQRLMRFLRKEQDLIIVAECASGPEALDAIRRHHPDVAFLDVRMPGLDAFGILQALRNQRRPAIILVTASEQFALRAFDFEAVDYLLKPFDRHRFQTALRRVRRTLHLEIPHTGKSTDSPPDSDRALDRISVRSAGRISLVKTCDIDWISAADNYIELHVGARIHLLRMTLTALGERLGPKRFARISRSILVNQEQVKEIRSKSHGDFIVLLNTGAALPGSRNYREGLEGLLRS